MQREREGNDIVLTKEEEDGKNVEERNGKRRRAQLHSCTSTYQLDYELHICSRNQEQII